ncbi:MAG: N-6 DNA methylase [Deltaproteobacteria bacterium]|nr:N-6 DNA methylase [Deltaproteobacteria bacterium]
MRKFSERLAAQSRLQGDPEERLKLPVSELVTALGSSARRRVDTTREFRIAGVGRLDIAVFVEDSLTGVIELKAPGRSINPKTFKSEHDKKQWESYQRIPNFIYTNGHHWMLYQGDDIPRCVADVTLNPDVVSRGASAIDPESAKHLAYLVELFLLYKPLVPKNPLELARILAPRCRLLRDAVLSALDAPGSKLRRVADEWRRLLFADVDDAKFADAYAQTVTYALLMERLEHPEGNLNLRLAPVNLEKSHGLLAKALETLTYQRSEIDGPIELLERTIGAVDAKVLLESERDPWLYFYEDFLAAYDPKLRKDVGAYYTPIEVVSAQTRLVRELLVHEFKKPLGFADPEVTTLDPACGTGTYPLFILMDSLSLLAEKYGQGSIAGHATQLGRNIAAFELLVGPYAVAHMRLTEALLAAGARLPEHGAQVYLSDTLETPNASAQLTLQGILYQRLVEEHERARRLRAEERVFVCIGNPPYDRQEIEQDEATVMTRKGGWVRFGDSDGPAPILNDFLPTPGSEAGKHVKNLYNDYVYFLRWAIWKVFEQSGGGGAVSFITASSYLRGPGFVELRRHLRRMLDALWIIDIGGDARSPRKTVNVFAIQRPVCIIIAFRRGRPPKKSSPAKVWYTRLPEHASRDEKLQMLGSITNFSNLRWQRAPDGWTDPFVPGAVGDYATWPRLADLFPWQHSGAQWKRTWPVGETKGVLQDRWQALLQAEDRELTFRPSRDRTISRVCKDLFDGETPLPPLVRLPISAPIPPICAYGWRVLDRQWCIADNRLGDFLRPQLWQTHSDRQVFLTTLMAYELGEGPAVFASANVPDLHHFRGSYGGADVMPLWRDVNGKEPNIAPGLLDLLSASYGQTVKPEDFLCYVYGIMAHPGYSRDLHDELTEPGPRVPITKSVSLFERVVGAGRELLWWHTFGQRMKPRGKGWRLHGQARCVEAVPEDDYPRTFKYESKLGYLRVGSGVFAPVHEDVWKYQVSGLHVLRSWLGFRMQDPRGKSSSPLDSIRPASWSAELTRELLEVIWVIEASLRLHERQEVLFMEVLNGERFKANQLPVPPPGSRKPPTGYTRQEIMNFSAAEEVAEADVPRGPRISRKKSSRTK